ncbi:hypothetical protein EVA_12281 [gut metagenome]|uniref:Uncharacterized protein n=1 Tax=gut metagenome TaxID=749906 RepID=J9FXB1_9ZZZZ
MSASTAAKNLPVSSFLKNVAICINPFRLRCRCNHSLVCPNERASCTKHSFAIYPTHNGI